MRVAIKAALLSGLVFPGLGQLLLKHYARGLALMVASLSTLILLVERLTRQATLALERLVSEGGPIAVGNLHGAASAPAPSGGPSTVPLLLLMLAWWVVAIVDAYRLGRRKDLLKQAVFRVPDPYGSDPPAGAAR